MQTPARSSWGVGFGLVHTPYGWAHFHTGNDQGCSNYMVAYPIAASRSYSWETPGGSRPSRTS